tara:strand:+ start:4001 stop:4246 length:246 start_codon:yes stop_codon:yes gene_type:complete
MKLLIEAVVVGLSTVIMGTIIGYILGKFNSVDLPSACKQWNKNHIMELSLFLTGFLLHLIWEMAGLNKWYCKNGNACIRKK